MVELRLPQDCIPLAAARSWGGLMGTLPVASTSVTLRILSGSSLWRPAGWIRGRDKTGETSELVNPIASYSLAPSTAGRTCFLKIARSVCGAVKHHVFHRTVE